MKGKNSTSIAPGRLGTAPPRRWVMSLMRLTRVSEASVGGSGGLPYTADSTAEAADLEIEELGNTLVVMKPLFTS